MYIDKLLPTSNIMRSVWKRGISKTSKSSKIIYTTWKVDGATPMYWFIMALTKPPFGSCAIYFHHGVRKVDTLLQAPFGDFGQILRIDVSESGWPMLKICRGELMFKPCWRMEDVFRFIGIIGILSYLVWWFVFIILIYVIYVIRIYVESFFRLPKESFYPNDILMFFFGGRQNLGESRWTSKP